MIHVSSTPKQVRTGLTSAGGMDVPDLFDRTSEGVVENNHAAQKVGQVSRGQGCKPKGLVEFCEQITLIVSH